MLTGKAKSLATFKPWYDLIVGGYGQAFLDIPSVMGSRQLYATRDTEQVGKGSCGISQFDALPMTRRLLERVPSWNTLVDIGCGDGSYLLDLCASLPTAHGIGFDPDNLSVKSANDAAEARGLSDRVRVIRGSASAEIPDVTQDTGPFCFITAFVLQEILEQSGRAAISALLQSAFRRYPDAHWIVIEVDNRADDEILMKHSLSLAYYNPYYLIHNLTQQRLESAAFWEELFTDCGLRVLATEQPDSTYDSLGLKLGYLLGL